MKRSSSLLVALLGSALLVALLGTWVVTGWGDARARADAIEREPVERASQMAMRLASELGDALERIRGGEDRRPYYEYQNLFHDPRGASTGLSVNPSPLVERTADPLVAVHYQIDPAGVLTIPPVNEDVPELSQQAALADNRVALSRLRASVDQLGAAIAATREPVVAANSPPPQEQVQQIDPEAFAQNSTANMVFQQVKTLKTAPRRRLTSAPVEIVTAPFVWRTSRVAGAEQLVAIRAVTTPAGTLAQGFVIDTDATRSWLRARAEGETGVVLAPAPTALSAPVPTVQGWHIAVEPGDAVAGARAEAGRIRARFWWIFGIAATGAIIALAMLVLLVVRSEQLARERSRFAAAAAHELRTPLAGLQLYGEMLADGLGDPTQSQSYAQRVSDEAARLGRVVGNVLGFTELERGTLAVDVQPGDLSTAVTKAVERSRSSLEGAGVTLDLDARSRVLARFDEDALARIMQNLLDNAEKYSRESSDRSIEVSVDVDPDDDQRVMVAVADSGPGVPVRARDRIFRPFERATGVDGAAGLGLGLALARTLARDQGGDLVCADSESGARFCLFLPSV